MAVPPAYYAHLAAFRARFYMEPEASDGESTTGGTGGHGQALATQSTSRVGAYGPVKPLPALKDNVKKVMFYC